MSTKSSGLFCTFLSFYIGTGQITGYSNRLTDDAAVEVATVAAGMTNTLAFKVSLLKYSPVDCTVPDVSINRSSLHERAGVETTVVVRPFVSPLCAQSDTRFHRLFALLVSSLRDMYVRRR